ncbi:iron-containing alcohol dehydrogenase [Plautia stali symbiont]|nr:iron-containing alcohol dehydrogenase [Plautia stali symbiont]
MQRVNFCFAKVINFLSGSYQNVCPGSGVAFGYTTCFMPTDKDLQVSENLIELYSNQQTLFGRGSIDRLVPLLAANPQPTLLFCGRSFINSPAWARLGATLNDHILGYEIVSHEASPDEIDGWVTR